MVFINYRQEDTKPIIASISSQLKTHFGEKNVFVDINDIPMGTVWPQYLQDRLSESQILLVVVGATWGKVVFKEGENAGRLRLDDPEDWVRKEICTAINMGEDKIKIIVVRIDESPLPSTKWNCELDDLKNRQFAQLRLQGDFNSDFEKLCVGIECLAPNLKKETLLEESNTMLSDFSKNIRRNLKRYIEIERRRHAFIQLPLVSSEGQPFIVPLDTLRIDLPFVVSHLSQPSDGELLFIDSTAINDEFRNSHTLAYLQEIESKVSNLRRNFTLEKELKSTSHIVIVGDPGCGKSTLLQSLAHHYAWGKHAEFFLDDNLQNKETSLPTNDWIPILILCRDFNGRTPPTSIEDLFRILLRIQQFSEEGIEELVACFIDLLNRGRIILLIDGLDEIRNSNHRARFCKLLNSLAIVFPESPIVVTSRVVGFQVVKEALSMNYDHLVVAPLDDKAKSIFVENWARCIKWGASETEKLIEKVCKSRELAKLTDNIFLLAMAAQIQVFDSTISGRRIDIYRRAVSLMIQRQRSFLGPPLIDNEIIPHLEFLAYSIRKKGLQRFSEIEAIDSFQKLRRLGNTDNALHKRTPEVLLDACIESLGILQVAGTEIDNRGLERNLLQFFHQSFQEYFAGQAIKHGYEKPGISNAVSRIRELMKKMEIHKREFKAINDLVIVEPIFVDYWQEAVRFAISDLNSDEANEAILMLLPGPDTPADEARPRAIFALFCLADEPKIDQQTALAVFDSAIESIQRHDGINNSLNSWMDEGVEAVSKTSFNKIFGERLLSEFIRNSNMQGDIAGAYFSKYWSRDKIQLLPETANKIIGFAKKGLSSGEQTERVRTSLELLNYFYDAKGILGFLSSEQQAEIIQALVSALTIDKATQSAAIWALGWLTNAFHKDDNNNDSTKTVFLPSEAIIKIEQSLKQPGVFNYALARGCLLMTRQKGLVPVFSQRDWIYEIAVIADGAKPRRSLPPATLAGKYSVSVDWMLSLLKLNLPMKNLGGIALALGGLGIFSSDMINPLKQIFMDNMADLNRRDEALIYLSLIAGEEVIQCLIEAADTPPPEKGKDYLYSRGLFGLILMDNIYIIANRIEKALPHSDLKAYAFCLAGSTNSKGIGLLEKMKTHSNPRIKEAAIAALAKPWKN